VWDLLDQHGGKVSMHAETLLSALSKVAPGEADRQTWPRVRTIRERLIESMEPLRAAGIEYESVHGRKGQVITLWFRQPAEQAA
jgi:hypothetical protein